MPTDNTWRKMGYNDNRRDNRSGGFRQGGFNRGPREMHDVTCAECGGAAQVPFKPDGSRPVYCSDCFQKHKPQRNDRY